MESPRLLILTSKNHPYANLLLRRLFDSGALRSWRVFIVEQDCIIPGRSKIAGLLRYVQISGIRYVLAQILRQTCFILRRSIARYRRQRQSFCFPFSSCAGAKNVRILPLRSLRSPGTLDVVRSIAPELILSLFSKEIISDVYLRLPRFGCYNLHPSFLPAYRGVSPTFWVLARGEEVTGVSLHTVDHGIDTGVIIAQKQFSIQGYMSEHALYCRAVEEGVMLVQKFLATRSIDDMTSVAPITAVESTYFSLPTREAVHTFYRRGFRCGVWDLFRS